MATKTWVGASAATWNTVANWTGGLPAANDDLIFNAASATTASVNINAGSIVQMQSITTQNSVSTNRWNLQGGSGARSAVGWTIPVGGATVNTTDNGITFYFNNITGGKITKTGPGFLFIPYLNTSESLSYSSWSGGIDVQQGSLETAFNNNGANNQLFGTGVLTFAAGTQLNNGSPTAGYAIPNNVVVNGNWSFNAIAGRSTIQINGTLSLNNAPTITVAGSLAVANGVVSGTTGFTKEGAGSLTLGTANTLSGVVRNNAGTLTVSNVNGLQNATFDTSGAGTVTLQASSSIGGLTGSSNFVFTTALTLGGSTLDVSAVWAGGFNTATLNVTKVRAGTQQLGGTSTRTGTAGSNATAINAGAIQLNSNNGLYGGAATGVTTVASGAGLWLSGGITTPTNALITINGQGVSLDGAIRNVSGSNTIGSSITLASTSTIKNDVSGTTLALKGLFTGTSSELTLAAGSGATIRLDGVVSGSSTSRVLIPSTNAGTVQANITSLFFNMSVGTTVQIDSAFDLNGINQTFTGILDGIGSMSGAGTVTMRSGATLKAGSGAGGGTLSMGALVFDTGSETMSLVKNGGALSKVAVSGAVTHTGTVTVTANSTAGWTSGSTHTFLTYGSRSGAATFAAGALSGGTARQVMSIDTPGATAATFTVVDANASVTWAGGDSGNWYDTQATGWSGSGGITDFRNGDTVTFGSNTTTATLTGNVNVASLTMNTANHTIGGAFTLTNAGALAVSGASFRQIINAAGEHAAVSVGTNAALELGNANALGSNTTAITLTGTNAKLAFNSGANDLLTNRALTFTPGGAVSQYLETSGDAIVTIAGTVTNGTGATASIVKVGSGLVALTGTNSALAIFRIGDVSVAETAGRNVLRLVNPPGATAAAMRLNGASVLELTSNFSKVYGTSAGQIYLESGAGAGFSAYNASGISVSTSVNFGTTAGTQWNGPMYFGTALGTATGKLTMSGTLAVTASVTVPQTLHVFNGASAGAASSARINTLNSSLNPGFTFIKTGPGALFVVNGTYGAARATMRVSEGAYEVGPTTLNATGNIQIPSGATNAVVRQESSVAATTCPDFDPAPAANFEIEAAGTDTFTLGVLNIGNRTVTLSGNGVGVKATDSGNGTGKYVKTDTGTWSLNYAYPSRAAGFSGGIDATQGTIKTNKKFGFGNGTIAITAGANVQFTDLTTDPAIIGSITSLTTTGSTARLIIGA